MLSISSIPVSRTLSPGHKDQPADQEDPRGVKRKNEATQFDDVRGAIDQSAKIIANLKSQ